MTELRKLSLPLNSMVLIAILILHNQAACSPEGGLLATNNKSERTRILFNKPLFSSYYVQNCVLKAREDIRQITVNVLTLEEVT